MEETGNSGFSGLKVNEELSLELKEETSRILSNIYKKKMVLESVSAQMDGSGRESLPDVRINPAMRNL